MQKRILGALAAVFVMASMAGTGLAKEAKGVWLTESKKAHVQIYDCGSKLCGKIIWLREPNDENGKPKVDVENAKESKRSLPLMGSNMISGMVRASSKLWNDGEIYNAEDGKTYSSKMEMTDDKTLEVSGCILFFCKAQTWVRVK
ncbi:MAG TPA: DUF2147 domain-containing protein [Rhodospirillales bacterium]|nr:DUF2147 domain-containing protein [Rhodospirillales bacterium]